MQKALIQCLVKSSMSAVKLSLSPGDIAHYCTQASRDVTFFLLLAVRSKRK